MPALSIDPPSELVNACPKCHGVKWAASIMCGRCSNPKKWYVAIEDEMIAGVVVEHEEYGIGTVLRWEREGVVAIRFPSCGVRRFVFTKTKFKVLR